MSGRECVCCGVSIMFMHGSARYCQTCIRPAQRVRVAVRAIITKAIRERRLGLPTEYACVDCGARAACYDHRDYSRPLDVEPVCRSCNSKRGPAAYPANGLPSQPHLLRQHDLQHGLREYRPHG